MVFFWWGGPPPPPKRAFNKLCNVCLYATAIYNIMTVMHLMEVNDKNVYWLIFCSRRTHGTPGEVTSLLDHTSVCECDNNQKP